MAARSAANRGRSSGKEGGSLLAGLFKLFLWVAVPLLLLYGIIWWRVDSTIRESQKRMIGGLDITHARTFVGLQGDITLTRLRMAQGMGGVGPVLRSDAMVVHTPGLFWLLRNSLLGMPKELPTRLGFSLRGYDLDTGGQSGSAVSVGPYSASPYDHLGCQSDTFMRSELAEMGLAPGPSSMTMRMERRGRDGIAIEYEAGTPGVGRSSTTVRMSIDPQVVSSPQLMAMARLDEVRIGFEDLGFVGARNRACASRHRMSEPEFVARHVAAVRQEFNRIGVEPGAAMVQAYERFSSLGGEIELSARPDGGMPIMQLAQLAQGTPASMMARMNAMVRVPGLSAAPINLLPYEPPRPPRSSEIAPLPVAAQASATAPGSTGAPPVPETVDGEAGEPVPYETLANLLGQRIRVTTTHGTVRVGRLDGYGSNAIRLTLVPSQGGFALSMPRYSIADVRLITLSEDSPATDSNAETN